MKTRTKHRLTYIGIVALLLIPYLTAQSTETTTIRIQLDVTGSALWIVESRLVLATEEDETLFEEFIKDETLKDEKLSEFREKMNLLLEKIKYSRKRSMTIADFDIFLGKETTVTKTYGVIRFQFMWDGFAVLEGDTIMVGDVFEGGYYISRNEILIVELPEGYHVAAVAPTPDHQKPGTLIWEGSMNFASGEPAVIIERDVQQRTTGQVVPIAVGVVLVSVLIVIAGSKINRKEEPKQYMNDKKLIVETIKQHKGTIAQKRLPDLTGFSKAKISILLNELKEEGIIRKTFRGRENLITLTEGN